MENTGALWTQEYCDNEIYLVYSRIDKLQISLVQVNCVLLHVERDQKLSLSWTIELYICRVKRGLKAGQCLVLVEKTFCNLTLPERTFVPVDSLTSAIKKYVCRPSICVKQPEHLRKAEISRVSVIFLRHFSPPLTFAPFPKHLRTEIHLGKDFNFSKFRWTS